jgi:methylglyoxal synthase
MWNYNDFDERKPKIIRLIKKHDPDIVALMRLAMMQS